MWKRKMKIKWNKKKLKRNCCIEEEEKVNDVKEKNENKWNKKKLKSGVGEREIGRKKGRIMFLKRNKKGTLKKKIVPWKKKKRGKISVKKKENFFRPIFFFFFLFHGTIF